MTAEIREDITTRNRVIFAGERGDRPSDFEERGSREQEVPRYVPDCPFCPGNENLIPPILEEYGGRGGEWRTRVIPNKYPVLKPDPGPNDFPEDFYRNRLGAGKHEIIIEHPRHDLDIMDCSPAAVTAVVKTYRRRFRKIRGEHPDFRVIIFRNRGPEAGTSLLHPHSQLIAGALNSPRLKRREDVARQYFQGNKRCLCCDILKKEEADGRRVVVADDSFLVFIPFAAAVPFETWVIPRRHQPEFGGIAPGEIPDLARIMREVLQALRKCLGDFPYNYMFSAPIPSPQSAVFTHWHLKIYPRLSRRAGFEIETGIRVNPVFPEKAAARLREELSA